MQAFFDLENGNQELKSDLKDLYINGAVCVSSALFFFSFFELWVHLVLSNLKKKNLVLCRQMDVPGNRKAVIIHVPYRLQKSYKKIHVKLIRELEKKFSGKVRK